MTSHIPGYDTGGYHTYITVNGVTKTQAQWARELGTTPGVIRNRIVCWGYSLEKAVTYPLDQTKRDNVLVRGSRGDYIWVEWEGERLPLNTACKRAGVSAAAARRRVAKGMTPEEALADSPPAGKYRNRRMFWFKGRKQTLSAWAEEVGLGISTLRNRLDSGWKIERALTEPLHPCGPQRAAA